MSGDSTTYCTARRSNGDPCKRRPIKGGTVCPTHGGSAPQTKAAAARRILAAADPAAAFLVAQMYDETLDPALRQRAARDLLDRAGLVPRSAIELEVEVKPWQQDIEGLLADLDDDPPVEAELVADFEPLQLPRPQPTRLPDARSPRHRRRAP